MAVAYDLIVIGTGPRVGMCAPFAPAQLGFKNGG